MKVSEAVKEFRDSIKGLAPGTQRWYMQKLGVFAAWCTSEGLELEDVKPSVVKRYIEHIKPMVDPRTKKTLSSATVKAYAQIVRTFLRFCREDELLEEYVSDKTARRITMPKVESSIIETFTDEQINALLEACEQAPTPALHARNRAIISVLLDTGVRASELCTLTLGNVFLDPGDAFIRVMGKGRKEREIGLGRQARKELKIYITRYRKARKGVKNVFVARDGKPTTGNGLNQMLYQLRDKAGIEGVRVSCHTFRHTFAVTYLKNEIGDVYKLSRLLGHTSISITEGYLRAFKQRDARNGQSVLDSLKRGENL